MKNGWLPICGLMAAVLLGVSPALAHRVNVFAWTEGSTVRVEGSFAGGKPVCGGLVTAMDAAGEQVASCTMDENGECSFEAAPGQRLTVVLDAGLGHRGEWVVREQDWGLASAPMDEAPKTGTEPVPAGAAGAGQAPSPATEAVSVPGPPGRAVAPCLSAEDVERIVGRALETRLAPLRKTLAEAMDPKPGIRDIVGGVGWILGVFGAAALAASRRKGDGK
ncbi:MAG: hypothetical protein JRI97_01350 [Deltaproteobacteria bacterium]|nr:hypothetical protein [Deltaproteobacteria bacterium]